MNIDLAISWTVNETPCRVVTAQFVASRPKSFSVKNRPDQSVGLVPKSYVCQLLQRGALQLPAFRNLPDAKKALGFFRPLENINELPPPVDPFVKQ